MENKDLTQEKMQELNEKIKQLLGIVNDLEASFADQKRKFTIDGHLLGSIGEVVAAYHYGIKLHESSTEKHDGKVEDKEVQIKVTQTNRIAIREMPDYLLVLFLDIKNQKFYEVYNGPGEKAWGCVGKRHKVNNTYTMSLSKLMEANEGVIEKEKIRAFPSKQLESYKVFMSK